MRDLLPTSLGRDLPASVVVFLVALPLCMGIAIASGVPAEKGLVTGMVGGIVVGLLGGAPLQVSGPAAGLAVIVFEAVREHGLEALGPILVLAGLIQFAAGLLRLGGWFRAISPAVVHGMLAGIGVLIVLAQLHVLVDRTPQPGGIDNLAKLHHALAGLLPADAAGTRAALLVGAGTILAMLGWERVVRRARGTAAAPVLRFLPGALIGVLVGTGLAMAFALPVRRVAAPDNLLGSVAMPSMAGIFEFGIIATAVVIAVIASAETLLSAAAVDRMHDGPRTRYNRELAAHGLGNLLCGLLGALPMTGVIVRSSANVQAGAASRWSAVLHGLWIVLFVALLPGVLRQVPTASLAGVLVVTGWRLVNIGHVKALFRRYGPLPAAIWATTFILVISVDLLTGVVAGLLLAAVEQLPRWRQLALRVRHRQAEPGAVEVQLAGNASFLQLPRLAAALEQVPSGSRVRLRARGLRHLDHTCAELIADWASRATASGTRVEVHGARPAQRDRLETALGGAH